MGKLISFFPVRFSIGFRLVIICALLGLAPLAAVGLLGKQLSLDVMEEHAVKNLRASSELQYARVEDNLNRVVKDVIFLSELHSLKRFLSGEQDQLNDAQRELLEFNRARPEYYQVRYLGASGHEVIRSNYKNNSFFLTSLIDLQYKGNRYYFQQGIIQSKGSVYFSPVDLNVEHGKVESPAKMVLRICTPVYVGDKKRGVIVINMFADEFFKWIKLPGTPFTSILLDEEGKALFIQSNENQYRIGKGIREGLNVESFYPQLNIKKLAATKSGLIPMDSEVIFFHPIQKTRDFNHPVWYLLTVFPKSYFQPEINIFNLNLIIAITMVAFISILAALYLNRKLVKPLSELEKETDLIAEGKLDHEPNINTGDEIEALAGKLNRMRLQLKTRYEDLNRNNKSMEEKLLWTNQEIRTLERQLYRADKLASIGELSMRLAHEIGNPLASIKTVAQAISEDIEDGTSNTSDFNRIVSEVDRLNHFLKKFNNFAVMKEKEAVLCDVRELVKDVNFFLRIQAQEQGVEVQESFASDIEKIMIDPQQIKQVLVNLILNAIQATEKGGSIQVSLKNVKRECNCDMRPNCFCKEIGIPMGTEDYLELSVCDSGKGISDDKLMKIFDPFYSTKQEGTGLGLSVVHRIVEQHNGLTRVFSQPGVGTTFKILLPNAAATAVSYSGQGAAGEGIE